MIRILHNLGTWWISRGISRGIDVTLNPHVLDTRLIPFDLDSRWISQDGDDAIYESWIPHDVAS